ncbi:retrovirus-related pol polyprotein from transposon TNT 1-94 [Tanacetum coccineum]
MKLLNDFSRLKTLMNKLENKLYAQDQSIQTVHMMLKPKTLCDENSDKAMVDPNPFRLKKAKMAQPALYDGNEILKPDHVPIIIPTSEADRELADVSREKMNEKLKDPESVKGKLMYSFPNYSKENFLATFTPQTQLTPEQVFWSLDLEKRKAEDLKANTPPLRILAAATVYPPNTPVHLVPRTLPTKCQTVISIFVLTQLFADFDKTCKKRITPTGITEGERGFEQTKCCYLTEVIPFFKLLKEHFEGVQKTLVTEVKEIKEIFKSMEAEVDQNAIDLRSGEIERKNLLITNENLIAKCIAQDVFYTLTESALTASHFHELSIAYNVAMTRAVELEAENLNLHKKIQNDDHDNMVTHLSRLEVDNLNLQLKFQHLKDRIETSKSRTSKDAPEFDAFFELNEKDAQLQTHWNTIRKLKAQISQLKANKSDVTDILLPQRLESLNFQLQDTINKLQKENDCFQAENSKIKQHYKELYDSIKIARTTHIEKITSLLNEIETLKTQVKGKMPVITNDNVIPKIVEEAKVERPLDISLASACLYTKQSQELLEYAIGTCPKDFNQRDKKHAATPLTRRKQVTFEDQCETSNSNAYKHVEQLKIQKTNVPVPPSTGVNSCTKQTGNVVQIILWYLDSGCSKHMTGDHSRLRNFMKKFIGTVRFGNDHVGAIMGYGDDVIGDSHTYYVRGTDYVELIKGSRGLNLYTISVEDMMKSSPIYLLSKASQNKSWLWHRRLNHLNFDTINDLARKELVRGLPRLKFKKDHLCSACQLGKSKKHTHKPKTENTNLEVLNTLHMDLCGPMRVQTINGKKYILVIVDDYSRYIHTDNGTEFVNQVLTQYYESVGIFHQTSVPRTPQQNGVVERRNRTLVEAARIMLIFSKAPMFLWAEAIAMACYTQNRSFIYTRHNKTPYELVHDKKPDLTFFRVFGALCYPTNDSGDLRKLQPIADIGILIGYAPSKKGY